VREPFSITALEEALDVDGAQEIIECFLNDCDGLLNVLEEAIQMKEQELLRSNAHKLSGCCKAIGADHVYQISSTLEAYAMQENWAKASSLMPELKYSYELISSSAKKYLNGA
jgi:HPt (histidine-containing phosphotransfer) domain-containing protein